MLRAPPAIRHIDDRHVECAEDSQHGGQRLHLGPGGEAAQEQVADVDEPQNQRGGEARVPGPPHTPRAPAPKRPRDEHYGAEDDADLSAGQCPSVEHLRALGVVVPRGQIPDGTDEADGEKQEGDRR